MIDLRLFIFPFIMAVITNSLMILLMFLLRKSKYFANLFGVGYLLVLYAFCFIRMFLPIEFPDLQIRLRDQYVYTAIVDFVKGRAEITEHLPFSIAHLLLLIWAAGSVVFLVRIILKEVLHKRFVASHENLATAEEQELLNQISAEVFKKQKRIMLNKTRATRDSITTGFFSYSVLIPDIEYDRTELEMILRHECIHIRDNDVWVKLLIEIYCIVFWWNPFSYLLKVDVNDTLENKCDLNVIKTFSKVDKLSYAETVAKFMSDEKNRKVPFVHSRFSAKRGNTETKHRMRAILGVKLNPSRQIFFTVLVSLLITAIFASSYLFIWQPYYEVEHLSEEDYAIADDGIISDDSNAYLVRQDDGNYIFFFLGIEAEQIPKEDVEKGLYNDYPIYEK